VSRGRRAYCIPDVKDPGPASGLHGPESGSGMHRPTSTASSNEGTRR